MCPRSPLSRMRRSLPSHCIPVHGGTRSAHSSEEGAADPGPPAAQPMPLRPNATEPAAAPAPYAALAVITTCQLMLIIDATIVNVALPSVQRSLQFSAPGLSWVVNAYTLAFGGLLP